MAKSALDTLLAQSAKKWDACGGAPESDLLKLAILRDLVHSLHAEKSRFLSVGQQKDAASLPVFEARIEDLRTGRPLAGDLRDLLANKTPLKPTTQTLPEKLFSVLEREKLERYDRAWEAALVSEGISQGWGIWNLEAWVDIAQVDQWNRALADRLSSAGIVLYVESAENSSHPTQGKGWHGRWVCLLRGEYKSAREIPVVAVDLPGTEGTPIWKLLYFKGM
jgi:hypothetical protein